MTADGAAAFAGYWFQLLSYATASGDTAPLAATSSPQCSACSAIVASIASGFSDGRRLRGGLYTVRSIHVDSFFELSRATLRVVFDRTRRTTVDTAGTELDPLPERVFTSCQIVLEQDSGGWRVLDCQTADPLA